MVQSFIVVYVVEFKVFESFCNVIWVKGVCVVICVCVQKGLYVVGVCCLGWWEVIFFIEGMNECFGIFVLQGLVLVGGIVDVFNVGICIFCYQVRVQRNNDFKVFVVYQFVVQVELNCVGQ